MGGTGIPGIGIPGMGGGMGGGRGQRGGGQPMQNVRGTIRWESAKPVLEAMKTELPGPFANHYVISMNGLPLNGPRLRRYEDDGDSRSTSSSTEDMLDRFKGVTFLEPKGGRDAQPGVVQQQPSSSTESVLFGFSKDLLNLKPEDKEVTFTTQIGRVQIRTKFNLKEMMYHGELAL